MPVVASNRGLKTGNTDDQYKQIYKRTYNHVIEKGKAAALDPIPEGLGSAYTDAFRHGRHDATANGTSNFLDLLTHRIDRFKAIGIQVLQEECEKHCLQLAHKWLYDVFGSRARNVSMLGAGVAQRSYGHGAMIGASGDCSGHMQRGFGGASEKAKTMLEQKLEDKFKKLMKKMEKTRRWNSYMTDDLRRAERDCLELIEDESSRQTVHAALEKARNHIETFHDKAKKDKLEKDAAAAYAKLEAMLKKMRKVLNITDTAFQPDRYVKNKESLDRAVIALKVYNKTSGTIKYEVDPDAKKDDNIWPNTGPTVKFFSKSEIDNLVDKIYQDTTNTYSALMLPNKFEALAFLYDMLTKYRRRVVLDNIGKRKRTTGRRSILGNPLKPSGNRLTPVQKAALAAKAAEQRRLAEEKRLAKEKKAALAAKAAERRRLAEEKRLADEAEAKARAEQKRVADAKAEAEAKARADAAERKRLAAIAAERKRVVGEAEARRQRDARAEARNATLQRANRQQEIRGALKKAMDDANEKRYSTIEKIYCESQDKRWCLKHAINNLIGVDFFMEDDFINLRYNDNGKFEGLNKTELDRLLKDWGAHENSTDRSSFRDRNKTYVLPRDRVNAGLENVRVLDVKELKHVLRRKDFLGFILGEPGHWVAIKRVQVDRAQNNGAPPKNTEMYVALDSVGPTRTVVGETAEAVFAHLNVNTVLGTGVDVVYAWSDYELLEHELEDHDALKVLGTYSDDFEHDQTDKRAKIKFEFIVLGVNEDKFKKEMDALKRYVATLSDPTHKQAMKKMEVFIEHLQELYNDHRYSRASVKAKLEVLVRIAAQAVADSPTPTPVITPVVTPVVTPANPPPSWQILQPDALSTSMSNAFAEWMSRTKEESESEDSEGEEEEETWEPMQEAMETALDQGWAAWRQAHEARASGAAKGNSTKFMALPEAPTAAPTAALPSPLRFMDHADAASYFSEGAPPSPPRVMIR